MSPWEESSERPKTCSTRRPGASCPSLSLPELAHSIPTLRRNLHGGAQCHPDVTHRHSRGDGALCRQIAQFTQHQVTYQGAAVDLPELAIDGTPELAQPHGLTRTVGPTRTVPLASLLLPEAPHANAPRPARTDQGASVVTSLCSTQWTDALANDHPRIEVRNKVIGHRVGNHIDALDNCQTVPYFTHNDRNRRL
jgi:hypothetical protein